MLGTKQMTKHPTLPGSDASLPSAFIQFTFLLILFTGIHQTVNQFGCILGQLIIFRI